MKNYLIKVEGNVNNPTSESFTVQADSRGMAEMEALNKCHMNGRLLRIFLDGEELFVNDSRPVHTCETVEPFKAKGFDVIGTGGGCEAFSKELPTGYEVFVTNDDSGIPETLAEEACIGLYNEGGEYIALYMGTISVQEFLNLTEITMTMEDTDETFTIQL